MAGLSYKPLSYTELSTYQLLCIKDVYQLIDTICADKYADWNIIDFEKAVVSNKYPNSYDEQSVRTAIESSLLRLDSEKPRKRYLEQGKHYAYELFLYLPEQFRFDEQPYKLFWAYMAREFSNNELPIEKKQFRERYIAVLKKFNMRLYSNRTLYVKRFSVKTRYGEQMELEERDIRNAFSTLEGRNQAYTRKYDRIADTAYLDSTITNKEVLMMSLGANNARAPKFDIPIWHKLNLTIDEAAAYSNIGIHKLYDLTEAEDCPFVLWIGSRRLIKRKTFDEYIEKMYSI